jgi:hypothetical protein
MVNKNGQQHWHYSATAVESFCCSVFAFAFAFALCFAFQLVTLAGAAAFGIGSAISKINSSPSHRSTELVKIGTLICLVDCT